MGNVTVLRAPSLTTVQDLGRVNQRQQGVSVGGALDHFAARVANLLVGNPEEAALLEITLGGLRLQFSEARAVGWCGGSFEARVAEAKLPAGRRGIVRPGEALEFDSAESGGRAWIAISGGIDVPPVLGSRSTDLRSAFGGFQGRALRDGDVILLGKTTHSNADTRLANWSAPVEWAQTATRRAILRVVEGSEWDEFLPEAQTAFFGEPFTVTAEADRMGARLEGAKLRRTNQWELPSEAVAPGAVQVAHDGKPILLLGDCQTVGGYPKIAHVITVDLPKAAQLRPNDTVRFLKTTVAEATMLFAQREKDLQRFRVALSLRPT